jgi:hypothetical protein
MFSWLTRNKGFQSCRFFIESMVLFANDLLSLWNKTTIDQIVITNQRHKIVKFTNEIEENVFLVFWTRITSVQYKLQTDDFSIEPVWIIHKKAAVKSMIHPLVTASLALVSPENFRAELNETNNKMHKQTRKCFFQNKNESLTS